MMSVIRQDRSGDRAAGLGCGVGGEDYADLLLGGVVVERGPQVDRERAGW
ncbi:hypothetical protein ONA70_29005 [Micromonospora yasonensis]|nr:hypothetical protein [Micromonospora yasonensis]MCW3844137.1 hypothetical protein [Micromonospora yasonensis]